MKKSVKSSILTLLCGAMIAAAGSCAVSQTYPVTVDGEKMRAGLYILEQQQALSEAYSKLKEEQPDLDTSAEGFDYFAQTVEGSQFGDWANAEALENCREYIAVLRLCDQYGVSIPADELVGINSNVRQVWTEENMYAQYFYGVDIVGKYYEKLGVGEQSYKDFQIETALKDKLFEHLYGEGGELAATEDEINTSLSNDYIAVNYFPYELKSGESAQAFADRIAGGESYEDVYRDYAQALSDEEAAAAAAEAADETAENGETAETAEASEASEPEKTTVEAAEKDSLIQIIKKSSDSPSKEFIDQASAMNAGEVKVITVEDEDNTHVYVVQKLDILSLTEKTADTKTTIRKDLKTDEFNEMLKSKGAGFTLTTDSSINMYKPEKLTER